MRGARISQNWNASGYWNVTAKIMRVLHFPKVSLGQIESLVFSAAILLIFLESFGAYRRHSSSKMFRVIAWTAYTIPPSLINYTQGLMQAVSFKNELFIIWATFLIMLLGSADSITAYSHRDNEQWKRHSWQLLIKMAGLGLLVLMYADASTLLTALEVLYCVAIVKVTERACAARLASKAVLQRKTKWIVDYTKQKHPKSNQGQDDEVDLSTMKGFTYMVDKVTKWGGYVPLLEGFFKRNIADKANAPDYYLPFEVTSEHITVERVWQCQGKLLTKGDSDHRFKDLCLSFALFRILSARHAAYIMPPEVHHKLWKLFQKIIKSEDKKGAERAFAIIEVELALLFYQLYTKCQIMFQFWVLKCIKLGLMIAGSCIVASTIMHHLQNPKTEEYVQLATSNGLNIDVLLTAMVIITVLVLEITSLVYFSCFTEWGKVSWICSYVHYDSWQIKPEEKNETPLNKLMETLIGFICGLPTRPPWERKLSQYSLLKSYTYRPRRLIYNCVTTLFFDQERVGRTESHSTKLTTNVKSAVFNFISTLNDTKREIGITSLNPSMVSELLWACEFKTQAQVIMVWHIATAMCEDRIPVKSNTGYQKDFEIATSLSKYLAYLVAFAPRLLPGHPYITEFMFDQVIREAEETFSKCSNEGDRVRELEDVRSREESETVIDSGARLGKQLFDDVEDPEIIWKVLAEFWVHRMAYVAPSDNITAHVEHLTMGGEFITHVWALLTHCGIKRKSFQEEPMVDQG